MFLLSLILFILLLLHTSIRYSRYGRLIHKIPGPFSFPIIGNLFVMVNLSVDENWHQRRKLLAPAFHPNVFKIYLEVMNNHIKNFISYLKSTDGETVESLIPLLNTFTFNIICESALGINTVDAEGKRKYLNTSDEMCEIIADRIPKPYITDWMMKFLSIGKKRQYVLSELHCFANKAIQERRKYHDCTDYASLKTSFQDDLIITDLVDKRRVSCLLDVLLRAQKDGLIDDDGIEDEIYTFIFAGFDTTKTALAFLLMLLAENKEAQTLARAEAVKLLDSSGGKITITELQNFEYIKRCIKESLRLFPSVPHIARKITKDVTLDNKYSLPTGSNLGICIFDLHRSPKFWNNPEKFDPDRFLPEHTQNRHPYAYIPFSAGPRNCIGQKFAMMEMISAVAHILYNFYLEPLEKTSEVTFKFHLVLLPEHPIHVKFIKINKK